MVKLSVPSQYFTDTGGIETLKKCAKPPLYSEGTQCEALSAASCHSYVLIFFSLTGQRLNVILKRETSAHVIIVPYLDGAIIHYYATSVIYPSGFRLKRF